MVPPGMIQVDCSLCTARNGPDAAREFEDATIAHGPESCHVTRYRIHDAARCTRNRGVLTARCWCGISCHRTCALNPGWSGTDDAEGCCCRRGSDWTGHCIGAERRWCRGPLLREGSGGRSPIKGFDPDLPPCP